MPMDEIKSLDTLEHMLLLLLLLFSDFSSEYILKITIIYIIIRHLFRIHIYIYYTYIFNIDRYIEIYR